MPILARAGAAAAKGFGMLGKIAAAVDEYFEYVTLLLHGNGTNGAQNNTFLDSSTNNFTITRNGNTTQGTFTPYGSNWSNYFDGTGDYLTVADNTALQMSGDFTWEAWVFPISNPSGGNFKTFWAQRGSSGGFGGPAVVFDSSGNYLLFISNAGATAWAVSGFDTGLDVTLNQWQHIALVKSGTTVTLYKNGVAGTSTTHSTAVGTNGSLSIMAGAADGSQAVDGYMSNFRIVKGTALYTSNFTPSISPLTAISGTSLLTCQSNRFIDNSSNNFTITRNGDVSVQRFSPFNPTVPYAAGTIGGSGYFDGTGDYLVISSGNVAQFGTGDFTMEAWVYLLSHDGDESALMTGGINFSTYTQPNVNIATNGTVNLNGTQSTSNTVPLNTWTHIAVSRNSGTSRIFINGVQGSSASNTSNYNGVGAMIGLRSNGSSDFGSIHAYISNVRYVNGTGLYTSAFTPNTAPLTAISGTSLLLNFTNGGIIDNAMMNDLETVGNAQISTSVSKFGGGSLAFDGSGDFVQTFASSPNLQFGTGDFTVEGWVYFNTSGQHGILQISTNPGGFNTSNTNSIAVQRSATGQWEIYAKNSNPQASATINQSQWYHFAVVRSGTTTTFYVNGVSTITVTSDSTNYTGSYIGLGAIYSTAVPLNGYIDDLRITKYARYTANFTPPAAPFPDQ